MKRMGGGEARFTIPLMVGGAFYRQPVSDTSPASRTGSTNLITSFYYWHVFDGQSHRLMIVSPMKTIKGETDAFHCAVRISSLDKGVDNSRWPDKKWSRGRIGSRAGSRGTYPAAVRLNASSARVNVDKVNLH